MHRFSQIYFGIEIYVFRTGLLFIVISLMMDSKPVRNM